MLTPYSLSLSVCFITIIILSNCLLPDSKNKLNVGGLNSTPAIEAILKVTDCSINHIDFDKVVSYSNQLKSFPESDVITALLNYHKTNKSTNYGHFILLRTLFNPDASGYLPQCFIGHFVPMDKFPDASYGNVDYPYFPIHINGKSVSKLYVRYELFGSPESMYDIVYRFRGLSYRR